MCIIVLSLRGVHVLREALVNKVAPGDMNVIGTEIATRCQGNMGTPSFGDPGSPYFLKN